MERDFKGVWISREIYLNEDLTPTEKMLLAEIDSFSKNGECFASNEHFAKFLGISKKHVSRLISKLVKMGLINVELIYKNDSKEVDKRTITPIRMEAPTPPHENTHPHPIEEDTPHRIEAEDKYTFFKQPIKNTTKGIKNNIKSLENEFEHLWKTYPKKQSKEKAKQSFLKARKNNVSLESIERGLTNYVSYIEINDIEPQYIKNGSTWFNGQCWNDEYNLTQRKKTVDRGFIGDYLDRIEQNERGGLFDYEATHRENFNNFTGLISESLQEF
jgi:hypothetical protein